MVKLNTGLNKAFSMMQDMLDRQAKGDTQSDTLGRGLYKHCKSSGQGGDCADIAQQQQMHVQSGNVDFAAAEFVTKTGEHFTLECSVSAHESGCSLWKNRGVNIQQRELVMTDFRDVAEQYFAPMLAESIAMDLPPKAPEIGLFTAILLAPFSIMGCGGAVERNGLGHEDDDHSILTNCAKPTYANDNLDECIAASGGAWSHPDALVMPDGNNNTDTDSNGDITDNDTFDPLADTDKDGLTNQEELDLGTDPNNPDSDNDTIKDGVEAAEYDIDVWLNGQLSEKTVKTDPLEKDTDDDGLHDGVENLHGTDPTNPDSDGDTIKDGHEVDPSSNEDGDPDVPPTDPTMFDTDGGGVDDGTEIKTDKTDPTNPADDMVDSDGDGVLDVTDNCVGTPNSNQANKDEDALGDACDPDIDNDGLPNEVEEQLGTDPYKADTDEGGINDGDEMEDGTHPLDPTDDHVDSDDDGVIDAHDNCVDTPNEDQADMDSDDIGDACDNDIDGDGLDNDFEDEIGSDPLNPHSDQDQIPDGEEVNPPEGVPATDPTKTDSDGDTIDDKTEIDLEINPNKKDTDGDGLDDNIELYSTLTDPKLADTDGGGTNDGDEHVNGTEPIATPADDVEDYDEDGLSYDQEIALGTDPANADTDGGGVNDGDEVANGTNPVNDPNDDYPAIDSDGDGLSDDMEAIIGTDPTNPDTDGGGTKDGDEVANGTDPIATPADDVEDYDGDGMSYGQEIVVGTDPTNPDTDGGGVNDGDEVMNGTNPVDNPNDDYPMLSINDPVAAFMGSHPDENLLADSVNNQAVLQAAGFPIIQNARLAKLSYGIPTAGTSSVPSPTEHDGVSLQSTAQKVHNVAINGIDEATGSIFPLLDDMPGLFNPLASSEFCVLARLQTDGHEPAPVSGGSAGTLHQIAFCNIEESSYGFLQIRNGVSGPLLIANGFGSQISISMETDGGKFMIRMPYLGADMMPSPYITVDAAQQ